MSEPAQSLSLLALARREAIAETSAALSAAARDTLVRHGDDPESLLLLEAGILTFLTNTEAALPGFRARLLRALAAPTP